MEQNQGPILSEERKAQAESPKMVKIPLNFSSPVCQPVVAAGPGEDLAGHLPGNSGPHIPRIPELQEAGEAKSLAPLRNLCLNVLFGEASVRVSLSEGRWCRG